ncbi:mCG114990 [Mus musculus]|nr:mCG114990 [Mus musculus]
MTLSTEMSDASGLAEETDIDVVGEGEDDEEEAGGPGAAALARSPFSIESLIGRTRGPAAAGAHVSSGAASGTAPGPGGGGCAVQAAAGPAVALTRSLVVAAAAAASSVSSSAALGTLHQGTALSSVENFTARISNC